MVNVSPVNPSHSLSAEVRSILRESVSANSVIVVCGYGISFDVLWIIICASARPEQPFRAFRGHSTETLDDRASDAHTVGQSSFITKIETVFHFADGFVSASDALMHILRHSVFSVVIPQEANDRASDAPTVGQSSFATKIEVAFHSTDGFVSASDALVHVLRHSVFSVLISNPHLHYP